MTRVEALNLLRIGERYPTAERIKQAYRSRAKDLHPDVSDVMKGLAVAEAMTAIAEARDYLLCDKDISCVLCNGSGRVRGRVGTRTCSACHGTGEK